jgi:Tfp pilus assembly protein PilF
MISVKRLVYLFFVLAFSILLAPFRGHGLPEKTRAEALKYFREGERQFEKGRYREAIKQYGAAIHRDRSLSEAYLGRGASYFYTEDYKRARRDFRKTLELDPNSGDTVALLARVEYYYGEYDAARRLLDRVKEKDEVDRCFEVMLRGPFSARWGRIAERLEGRSKEGHYYIFTNVGMGEADLKREKKLLEELLEEPDANQKAIKKLLRRIPAHNELGHLMDKVYKAYSTVFRIKKDKALVFPMVVFATESEYLRFSRELGYEGEGAAGYYAPDLKALIVYNIEGGKKRGSISIETMDTLFHEGFHQFLDLYLDDAPTWFDEGFAEYFGPSYLVGKKRLQVGVVVRHSEEFETRYEVIKRAMGPRTGLRPLPLREMMFLDQEGFERPNRVDLNYAQAWSMIHFLLSFEQGKKLLKRYFRILRGGGSRVEAFEGTFGRLNLEELERGWRSYVKGL